MRGLAGAVLCETRDLGIKWPQWHTLLVEGRVAADLRAVCPKDVKKMFVKRARMVCWKKWAATHEHEELKEGVVAGADPCYAAKKDKMRCGRTSTEM